MCAKGHTRISVFMDHTPKDVCHNKGGYLNRVSVGRSTAFGMIQWRVNPFDGTPFYQFKGFRNCSLTRRYTYAEIVMLYHSLWATIIHLI